MGKMSPGMKMLAVTQARRRRDDRGRFMEGDQGGQMQSRYMEGGQGGQMRGDYGQGAYNGGTEMRRGMAYDNRENRRGENDMRRGMEYGGGQSRRNGGDMRRSMDAQMDGSSGSERRGRAEMGGEGWFAWDGPQYRPPERWGQPESNRGGDMRGGEMRGGNVTSMQEWRNTPRSHMDGQGGEEKKQKIGFASEGQKSKHLDRETAEKWVKSMHNADGSRGGRWRMEEVQQVARNFGITRDQDMIDFYAVINAVRSDYGAVAKQFGVDKMDFYAAMAKAWMHDEDAVDGKAAMYYECIVKKEDEEEDD